MKKILFLLLFCSTGLYSEAQYCIPDFSWTGYDGIGHFQFNSLLNSYSDVNSTGDTVYSETDFTTYVTIGSSYFMQILANQTFAPGGRFCVWIDYNNDNDYSSPELVYSSANGYYYGSAYVTIPNDTSFTGLKRMRVMYVWNWAGGTLDPCGTYSHGEAEDYYIHITDSTVVPEYCTPIVWDTQSPQTNFIDNFKLNTIHNCGSGTEDGGYIVYPDSVFTTDLEIGENYIININPGPTSGLGRVSVFIDYDDNNVFNSSEMVFSLSNTSNATGYVTIPNDTLLIGKHHMRVRSQSSGSPPNPCEWVEIGETEDYFINIVPATIDTTTLPHNLWNIVYSLPGTLGWTSVAEMYDKGFIFNCTGGNGPQIFLVKTSIDGEIQWTRDYLPNKRYWSYGMDTTIDGGLVICGFEQDTDPNGDSYVMKLDACANIQWLKLSGFPSWGDAMHEVFQLPDSGYIVSANGLGPVITDTLGRIGLMRLDKDGNIVWFKDHSYYDKSELSTFIVTSDHGFLVTGYGHTPDTTNSLGNYRSRSILIKVDSSGQMQWKTAMGDSGKIFSLGVSSAEIPGSGYLTLCFVFDTSTYVRRMSLYLSDYFGNLHWLKPLTSDIFYHYNPRYIKRVNDNLYMIAANRYDECDQDDKQMSVFLIDSIGNVLVTNTFGQMNSWLENISLTSNNKILLAGERWNIYYDYNIWALKLNMDLSVDTFYNVNLVYDSLCDSSTLIREPVNLQNNIRALIIPNPCSGIALLKLENNNNLPFDVDIYNAEGILLKNYPDCRNDELKIDFSNTKPGAYFVRIRIVNNNYLNKKIIVFPE